MRHRRFAVVVGMLALLWASLAPAEEAQQAPAAAEPPPQARVEAAALLNESRWVVELRRMFTAQSDDPVGDTLQFAGGTLTSERLAPSGYEPAPFTLSIGPSGGPVWEATQLSPRDGIVLWRGELDRDTIRGTVSRLPLEGGTEDFRFEGKEILAPGRDSTVPASTEPPSSG